MRVLLIRRPNFNLDTFPFPRMCKSQLQQISFSFYSTFTQLVHDVEMDTEILLDLSI